MTQQQTGMALKTAELPLGGQLVIWGMRRWILAVSRREAPTLKIARPYIEAGCADAVPLLDETMTLLAATARRRFALRCVGHPEVGPMKSYCCEPCAAFRKARNRPPAPASKNWYRDG